MRIRTLLTTAATLAACLALAPGAHAQTKTLHADATTAQEVPPAMGGGTAKGTFMLNPATKELTWTVTYSGLSGDAGAAHIHGPAAPGQNAGVVVNLAPNGAKSPITGKATLTDAQVADLVAGKDYLNIHTAANKSGEVRGQIK
ncbi:MAG TPA: CHRD domain-containing protein [Candidatus Sulfotelmatobacter sp.]|nr:CHRD domain-containing protein [Candidatus Sulfotelmatobacter sp.]